MAKKNGGAAAQVTAKKTKAGTTPVTAIKHKDKRVNIPTEELRDFVVKDEQKPKTVLYPRDPSLDPQLVWKGKDEQDSKDLSVPAVPIYIQEKVHPQAIIENLKAEAKKESPAQVSLFSDFNGINFEDLIDFYKHESNWSNRMILGDSLLVMTSLAEKEGMRGKVQCVYIDPPYGIKFGSNWQVSTRNRNVKDGRVEEVSRQPEQIKAFRDTWALGIHSYLAYLRDRFVAARELLTESGSVFVQIGDENVHLVRSLLDEVFGSENFCSLISFRTSVPLTSVGLPCVVDYILWYAKDRTIHKFHDLFVGRETGEKSRYSSVELADGTRRSLTQEEKADPSMLPQGSRPYADMDLASSGYTASCTFPFTFQGKTYSTSSGKSWKTTAEGMERLGWAGRITDSGKTIRYILFHDDFPVTKLTNSWTDTTGELDKDYVVQTHTKVIERCVLMTTDPGDLVLDPTCGSGTTAYVAEQWGRRWITVDTSRVALALARTRLMAAKFPYYFLADSPEGQRKETELSGQVSQFEKTENDVRKGFVYKRVPHITLKSIANNPDIKKGMKREDIERAIARRAESELLYDQSLEDPKRIRVTGPFTVESLSPHRVLSTEEERPTSEKEAQRDSTSGQFSTLVIENLLKAGVQNSKKKERLKFDDLRPYPGIWVNATGSFTDTDGKSKRVAVSIGPEHGTVGPLQVKEAAKEAVKGLGHDILIVCGYAFDPSVNEEAKQYGDLIVLPTRMNADLSMGDELLKKTGAGNLFMVFGEPDITIKKTKDKKVTAEIHGVDVYDPTTGEIRSSSTDEIACWFIDTNYNGESFFVRHAYFIGADDPYEKLRKALRAEIDEAAWKALNSTTSSPFDLPSTGKIAVKVINHYGDEVLRVFSI